MKLNSTMPRRFSTVLTCVLLVASAMLLHAHEDEGQEIERSIALLPTANAPTNALGVAKLEVSHSGAISNHIELHTVGLPSGTYTVTVFDRSGASQAVLGTFATGVGFGPGLADDDVNDDRHHNRHGGNDDGSGSRHGGDDGEEDGGGEAKWSLPDTINGLDLGRISITDGSSVEVLVGDFSDLSNTLSGRVFSRVSIVNGSADDDASGVATISGRMRRGKGNGTFSVIAGNLAPKTTLTLVVNGEDAGVVTTDRRGRLRVRRNHKSLDVFSVSTVSLRDDSGGEVLKAQF